MVRISVNTFTSGRQHPVTYRRSQVSSCHSSRNTDQQQNSCQTMLGRSIKLWQEPLNEKRRSVDLTCMLLPLNTNPAISLVRICCCWQVLDEADRLLDDLDYNFGEQLSTIFSALPTNRQTLLFSATLTEKLQEVSELAMKKPFFWASKDLYVRSYPSR